MVEITGPFCYQIERLCCTTSLTWDSLRCTTRRSLYVGMYLKDATKARTVFSGHCFLMGMVVKRVNIHSMPPQPAKLYQVKNVRQLRLICIIYMGLILSKHIGHCFQKACCVAWSLPMRESAICTSMRETAYSKVIQSCT